MTWPTRDREQVEPIITSFLLHLLHLGDSPLIKYEGKEMWMWPWETIPEQGKTGFRVSEECWKCLMIWGAGKEYKEGVSSKETEVSRPLKVTYCRTLRTCQGMVWQEERALYLVKTGMWDSLHQIHAIQTISALITDLSTLLTLATSAHSGCGSWADASGLQLYLFLDILFFFF